MAIGALKQANATGKGAKLFVPVGVQGSIVQVHDDCEATAATATELLAPFGYAGANGHWVKRGPGVTRAYFYARALVGVVTITTSPVIRIYGAWPAPGANPTLPDNNTGAIPNDGTWHHQRLDNGDNNAAGLTLTLVAAGAGLRQDATYTYSDETGEIDLQDCWYFTALVETAAATSDTVLPIFARLIA